MARSNQGPPQGSQSERGVALVKVESLPQFQTFEGKAEDLRDELSKMRERLEEVLPSQIEPARFLRVAASTIIKSEGLMRSTRISIFSALMEAATLGLEPTGLLGSAYLVPYRKRVEVEVPHPDAEKAAKGIKVKVSGYITEAKLIPGYRGLIDLARRSGGIKSISAQLVRQRDHFRVLQGTNPQIEHEPYIPDPRDTAEERDPGPFVGVYMVAVLESGEKQIEWMTWDQVEAIRRRSKASEEGPWVTDPSEMGRKTVVRRGSKYLPLSPEFRRALELDEEAEKESEDPPPKVRVLSPAEKILAKRRGDPIEEIPETVADGPGGPEDAEEESGSIPEEEEAPGASVEVSPVEDGICRAEPPEGPLGMSDFCTQPKDHPGAHKSGQGSWPR